MFNSQILEFLVYLLLADIVIMQLIVVAKMWHRSEKIDETEK